MSNQNPKNPKLVFNGKNAVIGLVNLAAVVFVFHNIVDATTEPGQLFYAVAAVMTVFFFPWLEVKFDEESK
jgi:hypothetical protein